MRIIIDLQACQHGTPEQRATARDLALQLVQEGGKHEVWLALNSSFPEQIGTLRELFCAIVPASRFIVFDIPTVDDALPASARWLARAGDELRIGAFAGVEPDMVLTLDFSPYRVRNVADGMGHAFPEIAHAVRVTDIEALARSLQRDETGECAARLAQLGKADLLLVESAAAREALAALLPDSAIAVTGSDLWLRLENTATGHAAPAAPAARPRLAYISPLPPEKSGIADYSAELLPELARYYDIDVVIDQPTLAAPWIEANLPVRTVAYFEEHAEEYAHRLYHFGNSMMHRHMFGLLQRHPGAVVLHDFYLANVLHAMHHSGYQPGILFDALYRSHGFGAVLDYDREGEHAAVWKYPCNKEVLDAATGIIVHSAYPKMLAQHWYGPDAATHWHTLPLLRGHPGGDQAELRRAARAELGLTDDEFIVCSFGMLGPTKLNDRLLDAWLASPLVDERHCQLVFVGELGGGDYGRDLPARISVSPGRKRIRITGFVTQAMYQTYLAACDVAVQLRSNTRGETSAAVLDCLLHGIPTVINAHGAMAELPSDVLVKLEDEFDTAALADALTTLYRDPAARRRLSEAGSRYIEAEHSPAHVGTLYRDTLERLGTFNPRRTYLRQLEAVRALRPEKALLQEDLRRCARALAANQRGNGPRQLLVDVSAMVQTDLKTGIQRVVRSILQALLVDPPAGYRVEPVYSPGNCVPYRYARAWMQHSLKTPVHDLDDAPIETQPGDMFLGLDLMMHGIHQNRPLLQSYRDRGMQVHFVVYDLLPVLRPDFFPFGSEGGFADWLDTIGSVSDGLTAISRAVADELADWYETHPPTRSTPLPLNYFHLGADIDASAPSTGLPANTDQLLERLASRPTIVMVGTIEPRKGHQQSVDAFELLWRDGHDVNLVIVGKQGWMVDDLAKQLRDHPERDRRLFWLQGVSDELLMKVYDNASGLLAASQGEGFGLPLIEAAQKGIPIIARGLPVFREVAGTHAWYFDGDTPQALAQAMAEWLKLAAQRTAPQSSEMPWLTWRDSAGQLKTALTSDQPYRSVTLCNKAAT